MKGYFRPVILAAILLGGILGVLAFVNNLARAERLASPLATLVVDTLADNITVDGHCSLREAVNAANNNLAVDACLAGNSGTDTINFSVSGIVLLNTELDIEAVVGSLVIDGGRVITLSGGSSVRIFDGEVVLTLL